MLPGQGTRDGARQHCDAWLDNLQLAVLFYAFTFDVGISLVSLVW